MCALYSTLWPRSVCFVFIGVAPNSFGSFMKQKGSPDPKSVANMQPGAGNHVYPKAYRFFEQKRWELLLTVSLVFLNVLSVSLPWRLHALIFIICGRIFGKKTNDQAPGEQAQDRSTPEQWGDASCEHGGAERSVGRQCCAGSEVLRIATEMPKTFWIFDWKCRKNGELSLKNDDFVLKNGHLFCNSRNVTEGFALKHDDGKRWVSSGR